MKKIAMLMSIAVVAGSFILPAAPAHASFAGAATCDVTLDVWPTTSVIANSQACVGKALGWKCTIQVTPLPPSLADCPLPPIRCIVQTSPPSAGCEFFATVDSYQETCVGDLPPPIGTASGRLNVDGDDEGPYNWLRVGLTALILPLAPGTSAGAAAFVPHPPIPTCAAPGQLTATVVGVAVSP